MNVEYIEKLYLNSLSHSYINQAMLKNPKRGAMLFVFIFFLTCIFKNVWPSPAASQHPTASIMKNPWLSFRRSLTTRRSKATGGCGQMGYATIALTDFLLISVGALLCSLYFRVFYRCVEGKKAGQRWCGNVPWTAVRYCNKIIWFLLNKG